MDNTTTGIPPFVPLHPASIGYVAIVVAVVFFGSNYIPVKKFYSGNGIFFQWILCISIWMVGFICFVVRGFPKYLPLPMIGGLFWCTGNMMTVPIINSVGMAKGLLVWGSFNLLSGWASSRYGWFGVKDQVPDNLAMNYAGVVICLVSACMYLFMKTEGYEGEISQIVYDVEDVDEVKKEEVAPHPDATTTNNSKLSLIDSLKFGDKAFTKTLIGTGMAVCAGLLYGVGFIPVIHIKDHCADCSKNGLDYVFPHYCGILIASTIYFLVYCIVTKNNPVIYSNIILPGVVSGVMWGIANISWFIANDSLSESITYPIVATLPGIIGTLWGLFFREIKGWKNYLILVLAISLGIAGSVLTGLSK